MNTLRNNNGEAMMLFGYKFSEKVREFQESPFVLNHLKSSSLLSCYVQDLEYCVGDFVQLKNNSQTICQIESFTYKNVGSVKPQLQAKGKKYIKSQEFTLLHGDTFKTDSKELIQSQRYVQFEPDDIDTKIVVSAVSPKNYKRRRLLNDTYFVRFKWQDECLSECEVPVPIFCDKYIIEGKYLIHQRIKMNK